MRSVGAMAIGWGGAATPALRLRVRLPDGVLPAVLRRPARLLGRIDFTLPRRFGPKAAGAFLFAAGLYGVLLGGHVETIVGTLTAATGLKIGAVRISGQTETAELDVLGRLALPAHGSMVLFDAEAARARVESLDWVASATVRKIYPNTVEVAIVEEAPFARWQRDGAVALIDASGAVISTNIPAHYATLPLVVGPGAGPEASAILALIAEFPSLADQVLAATFVSERRWNLSTRGGVTVLLPEGDILPALIQLVSLDQGNQILSRDIVSIDLRMSDRVVVQLDAEVLGGVEAAVARARRNGGAP